MSRRCLNLVPVIRVICARELGLPVSYPFFYLHQEPRESIDHMLVRVFLAEHGGRELTMEEIEETVMVLVYG